MVKRRIKVVDSRGSPKYLQQVKRFGFWITVDYTLSEFNARDWLTPLPKIQTTYIYPPKEITGTTAEGPM